MKLVYMIIECSGEYEDYRERCVAAYFQEERAKEKLAELEDLEQWQRQQRSRCNDCYLYRFDSESEFEQFLKGPLPTYCGYIKDIKWDKDFEVAICDHAYLSCCDDTNYRIDTLGVEE